MREIRLSGSEGGVALTPPSLPLSRKAGQKLKAILLTIVDFNAGITGLAILPAGENRGME